MEKEQPTYRKCWTSPIRKGTSCPYGLLDHTKPPHLHFLGPLKIMAYMSRDGRAKHCRQAAIGRSLSLQDFRPWKTNISPLDTPGALPLSPQRKCLLTTSLPENADAVLSRTLFQQCCLDDHGSDISPRSSLKDRGGWTSRVFSDMTCNNETSLSTQRSSNRLSRLASSNEGKNGGSSANLAGEVTKFTKHTSLAQRNGQTSALSAALRRLPNTSNPAEHHRRQNPIAQPEYGDSRSIARSEIFCNLGGSREEIRNRSSTSPADGFYTGMGDNNSYHADEDRSKRAPVPKSRNTYAAIDIPVTSYSTSASSNLTNSDVSRDTAAKLLSSAQRKGAMLDRLMEYFFKAHMDTHKAGHGQSSASKSPASTSPTETPSSDQAGIAAQRSGMGKGKRFSSGQAEAGESDSDAEEERPNLKRRRSEASRMWKFACPFFKRNPQRYMERRACVGPGFKDVHRLKQVNLRSDPPPPKPASPPPLTIP